MPQFPRALPALAAVATAACSAAGTNLAKLGEPRNAATTAEETPRDSGRSGARGSGRAAETGGGSPVIAEGVVVHGDESTTPTLPVDVAGSFLVLCSADTQLSYLATPTAVDDTVGCVVMTEDGTPVTLDSPQIKLRSHTGAITEVAAIEKETSAPWGFGFSLPEGLFSEAVVTFEQGGRTETASTSRFDFRWIESPLFQAFLKAQLDSLVIPDSVLADKPGASPHSPPLTNGMSGNYEKRLPLTVFATAAEFDGAVTIAAADLECATRGTRLPGKGKRWVSGLTTSVTPLGDRFASLDLGPVKNLKGETIAHSLGAFLFDPLSAAVLYDDRGLPVTAPLNDAPYDVTPPRYNAAVWGPFEPACNDWTSAAAPALALVADVTKVETGWSRVDKRSCSRRARILCIGHHELIQKSVGD